MSDYASSIRQHWEYRVVRIDEAGIAFNREKKLNELGRQGWELVTVDAERAYLKRPI